jgi:hypothetical protein
LLVQDTIQKAIPNNANIKNIATTILEALPIYCCLPIVGWPPLHGAERVRDTTRILSYGTASSQGLRSDAITLPGTRVQL